MVVSQSNTQRGHFVFSSLIHLSTTFFWSTFSIFFNSSFIFGLSCSSDSKFLHSTSASHWLQLVTFFLKAHILISHVGYPPIDRSSIRFHWFQVWLSTRIQLAVVRQRTFFQGPSCRLFHRRCGQVFWLAQK